MSGHYICDRCGYKGHKAALAPREAEPVVVKPLPGELAMIQIAMETLRQIAFYSPVSRIQPVMIARDALKKIEALTFESEPVAAVVSAGDGGQRVSPGSVDDLLTEVIAHLGASIIQSVSTDDQIIMDHVKAAHELAKAARRQLKVPA